MNSRPLFFNNEEDEISLKERNQEIESYLNESDNEDPEETAFNLSKENEIKNFYPISNPVLDNTFNPNTAVSIEPEKINKNPKTRKKKNKKLFLFLTPLFAFLITSFSLLLIEDQASSSENNSPQELEVKSEVTPDVKGVSINPTLLNQNRIAYSVNGNIWIINSDGSNKLQITYDGDIYSPYRNISWRNDGKVSFSKCREGICKIFLTDPISKETNELISLNTPSINALRWSPSKQKLLLNYTKADGSSDSVILENGEVSVLGNYSKQVNPYNIDYEIDFIFSKDGKYFAMINTYIDSSTGEQVWIMDEEGNKLASISNGSYSPQFLQEGRVIFKNNNKLVEGRLGVLQSEVLIENFLGRDIEVNNSLNLITYTTQNQETQTSEIFDIISKSIVLSLSNIKNCQWLKDDNLICLKTEKQQLEFEFTIDKLIRSDKSGNILVLEELNVSEFDIE